MENFSLIKLFGIILVVFLLCNESNAQSYQFRLFGFNPCNGKIELQPFYDLKKGDLIISPRDTSGVCYIEEAGVYELIHILSFYSSVKDNPIKIVIDSTKKLYSDTLRLDAIMKCCGAPTIDPWSGFCNCGIPCEGYKVDYYMNGNKRIEGHFKKGNAIGKLFYYKSDGSIKCIEKHNRKGRLLNTRLFYYKTDSTIKYVQKYNRKGRLAYTKFYHYKKNGSIRYERKYNEKGKLLNLK